MSDRKEAVRAFLEEKFVTPKGLGPLEDESPLVTTGILDSIATLELVSFLEKSYGVTLEPHELDIDHIGSLQAIDQLLSQKLD